MKAAHKKYYPGSNGNKLTLDTDNAMIWGVCAGVADYFGFDVNLTRVCTAIAGVMFFPTVPIIYAIMSWVLDESPDSKDKDDDKGADTKGTRERDPDLSRRIRSEPHATLRSVRYRYRELERRLQRLEKHVTSRKYDLERELDGLGD